MTSRTHLPATAEDARLAESFNIYQATMTMLSIFTGFVFAALLQLVLAPEQLTSGKLVAIRILIASLFCFLMSMFSFHHTAHRVVRYWQIFLPSSVFTRIGSLGLVAGFVLMLYGLVFLLWERGLSLEAVVVAIASIALGAYGLQSRRLHQSGASYIQDIDRV